MIELDIVKETKKAIASIKVIGVGGAGGNTINSLIESGCTHIECIAINTDAQALELSKAPKKVQIGVKSTKGLGTGADPLVGRRAAEEDLDKVLEAITDADIVFLTGGMGGGTGSGALPVIAKALKERNILSIVIVTKPFEFEGKRRARVAHEVIEQLKSIVDTLIIIPNQRLLSVADEHVSMIEAFDMINQILGQSVRSISDIITKPGHINVDFADVRTIMKDRGLAVMGTSRASGVDRARIATQQAINSPLLENMNIEGAQAVLLNITGGKNLSLYELSNAASVVYEAVDKDANIILGSVIDESLNDEVVVTIIATGFASHAQIAQEISHIAPQEQEVAQPMHATVTHIEPSKPAEQHIYQYASEHKEVITRAESVKIEKAEQAMQNIHQTSDDMFSDLDVPTFMREKQDLSHHE